MNDRELQQLLDDTAAKLGVVGAQLAIYHGGEARELATGYRHRELSLPVTPDTLFQIGSTSKLFNAALVMSLVDAGELDLDAPVREYIADLHLADSEAEQAVTLRHLLSMSSGIDNGFYNDYGRGDDALGRYVGALAGLPQIFAPGAAFGYSNASINVAGHAAARVMGESWERLLTERIAGPLGLEHLGLLAEDLLEHPLALGYQRADPSAEAQRIQLGLLRSMGPSGALICCSAGDLIRFACMFLDGAKVLSEAAIETMQHPQVKLPTRLLADEWCIGPYRKLWGGQPLYGHSGTTRSGSSTLLWCPNKGIAIATTVNVAAQGYPLADAIFDEVFPGLFDIEKPRAAKPEDMAAMQTDLRPYIGRFEAFGMTLHFGLEDGTLMLNGSLWGKAVSRCKLIPLGEGRFFPCDPSVSGNRNWDIAFWGRDSSGRATHLLQGVFPLRRTG